MSGSKASPPREGRYDLIVTGNVVTPAGILPDSCVGILDGVIEDVWRSHESASRVAREHFDASGRWVFPGFIDAHVHCFSEPSEGFTNATRAAAAGGVTTVVEMPYDTGAPVTNVERLERKKERLASEALVDVALLGTIRKTGGLDQIPRLAEVGVCGFKLSLFETDPERFPRIDDGELLDAFRLIREVGLPVGVHAEDGEIIGRLLDEYQRAGKTYPRAHCETRPPVSETSSVALALEIAANAGVHLHIFHASVPRTFSLVMAARARGENVTAETCPHYLLLDEGDMDRLGAVGKINPPLRSREDVAGLWRLIGDDAVDMVTSDHSPWVIEKKQHPEDIFANASGVPGVETLAPLLYSEGVAAGRISVEQFARLISAGPSRAFGLHPRKGQIAAGADADLAILDPDSTWRIEGRDMHSSAKWTPYEGRVVRGRIVMTLVRGRVVYDGKTVVATPGSGTFIPPRGPDEQVNIEAPTTPMSRREGSNE